MDFNYIDIVLIVPILFGLYKGFTKGLILSLATLVGLVLGIYGGVHFSDYAAAQLKTHFDLHIPLLAFAVTFLVIIFAVYLLGRLVSKFINFLALGIFNKVAGGVFGGLKILIIMAVAFVFFTSLNQQFQIIAEEQLQSSQMYQLVNQTSVIVLSLIHI